MTAATMTQTTAQPIIQEQGYGIYQIDADYVAPGVACVYLIREGDRLALVEAGTANTVPHILAAIEQLGLTPDHLDYVMPTHIHLDHAAGAGAVMQACPNAQLIIHPRGASHMIDPAKLEAGTRAVYGDEKYDELYGQLIPISEDRVTQAGDMFSFDFNGRTLTFMDTPGHAKHHFCIHDSRSNSVFSGDTFGLSYRMFDTDDGQILHFVTTTPVHFDPEAMRESIHRIANMKPEAVYLTHYGPVQNDRIRIEHLLDSLDAFVEIALNEKGQPEQRTERMTQAIADWLIAKALSIKPDLDEQTARKWLATDADLNAQGLEVWLQKQEAA